MPLTSADLDAMVCDVPGCTHGSHDGLTLVAACHPGDGLRIVYVNHELRMECGTCGRFVAAVAVAAAQVN